VPSKADCPIEAGGGRQLEHQSKPAAALVPLERLEQMRRLARRHALVILERQAGGPLSDDGSMKLASGAERWARGHTGTRRSATP
jgi:hypothetical protein